MELKDAQVLVVKVGTSTLTYENGKVNLRRLERLCRTLSDLQNAGRKLVLVSSGAIGVGMGKLGLPQRPEETEKKQALAAIGQCELMFLYDKFFGEYDHTVAQVPLGQREKVSIYGDDYDTRDGTCVRDYIHVTDLAQAHVLALDHLLRGGESDVFNLGNGVGFTVKEVIDAARAVTGHPIPAQVSPRRAGDPAQLVASSERAKAVLGWAPRYDELETILSTAWSWHRSHPNGYEEEKA